MFVCIRLVLNSVLSDLVTSGQVLARVSTVINMRLQQPLVIIPPLYMQKGLMLKAECCVVFVYLQEAATH